MKPFVGLLHLPNLQTSTDTSLAAACVIFGLVGVLFLTFHIIEMTFQDWSSIDTQQINRTLEGLTNVMWHRLQQEGVSPEQLDQWYNEVGP